MARDHVKKVPKGRLGRLTQMGKLATGLTLDLVGTAGRLALGGDRDETGLRFHRQAAKRLVNVLAGMKGMPMKVGQMLSYIDDFIPSAYRNVYREALSVLQVRSLPLRWREIEAVIRKDLGRAPREIFARFDERPIAAASIGQVYRAALQDGTEVAVKVQYPGIGEAIQSDLKNLDLLKNALSVILPRVDVERSLMDITARMHEECDYGCEGCNQEDFRAIWADDDRVIVPEILFDYSGDHVLTSTFVEGRSWQEMLDTTTPGERNEIARVLFRFVFRSLYVHGIFNGDPHPGNYVFPGGGRVAFLDFGCVQRYDEESIQGFHKVRCMALDGTFGQPFREAMQVGYGIPDTLDEEEWTVLEEYIQCCFEPITAAQPFRYCRAYTEKLADITLKLTAVGARKALRKGIWEAKRPGIVFLNRLQFGFVSILATMEAEADWCAILQEIDDEIAATRPWARDRVASSE